MTDVEYYAMMRLSDPAVTWEMALEQYLRENPDEVATLFDYFRNDDGWPCDRKGLEEHLYRMTPHEVYRFGYNAAIRDLTGPYFTLNRYGNLDSMSAEDYEAYCIKEICCEWDDCLFHCEWIVSSMELEEIRSFWLPGGDKMAAECLRGASFASRNIRGIGRRSR